jgi:uncharacterized phage protein (TIGR01671 family)
MREYLYRGIRVDNHKLVEGYYVKAQKLNGDGYEHFIIEESADGRSHLVIPETVSEYIGIHDKNGTKIFENDIVKTQERYNRPYSQSRKSKRHIGVVEYRIGSGSGFYNRETGKHDRYMEYEAEWIVKVKDYGAYVHGSWGDFLDCEVIGNIFENIELLEG